MYLIIFEDLSIQKAKSVSKDDLMACDDGYCQILDITDPENPTEYYQDEWKEIESV